MSSAQIALIVLVALMVLGGGGCVACCCIMMGSQSQGGRHGDLSAPSDAADRLGCAEPGAGDLPVCTASPGQDPFQLPFQRPAGWTTVCSGASSRSPFASSNSSKRGKKRPRRS